MGEETFSYNYSHCKPVQFSVCVGLTHAYIIFWNVLPTNMQFCQLIFHRYLKKESLVALDTEGDLQLLSYQVCAFSKNTSKKINK